MKLGNTVNFTPALFFVFHGLSLRAELCVIALCFNPVGFLPFGRLTPIPSRFKLLDVSACQGF